MEIHGNDIKVDAREGVTFNDIFKVIRRFWPDLVVEEDDSGTDFFVYCDEAAKRRWDADGWSEENDQCMIYVITSHLNTHEVWLVIDDNKENQPIVDALAKELA